MDVLLNDETPDDERSTLPPEADEEAAEADLLASVVIQLDGVARSLSRVTKSLAVLVGQRRSDNKRLTALEGRVAALEAGHDST